MRSIPPPVSYYTSPNDTLRLQASVATFIDGVYDTFTLYDDDSYLEYEWSASPYLDLSSALSYYNSSNLVLPGSYHLLLIYRFAQSQICGMKISE
jgi:hypothetical protein